MALDPKYFVTSDLEGFFVDKDTGLPLSNGILTFYKDSARTVLKPVYQLTGAPPNYTYTALPNPLNLSNVGTPQNASGDNIVIYYYPFDTDGNLELYYVTVQSEGAVEEFTREAWPNLAASSSPSADNSIRENQISNSTFTNILINDDTATVLIVSAASNMEFPIAPNWDLVISGTGSVVVQRFAITGNSGTPSSPPYVMDIEIGPGISICNLRQRFAVNSGLWASTGDAPLFLNGSFLARSEAGGSSNIIMYYNESSGGTPIEIVNENATALYQILSGSSAQIPVSADTNSGKNGYIDIYLSLSGHVRVSSIQLIPSVGSGLTVIPNLLDSSNRNEAFQGDYYIPRLSTRYQSSFLVGWDFTLNPFQFGTSVSIPAFAPTNNGVYIADQTIIQVALGSITYARNASTSALQINNTGSCTYALTQYLSGRSVNDMIGTSLSVNVFGYKIGASTTRMRVYLFRAPTATAIPTLPNTISTLNAGGTISNLIAGWTEIPRSNLTTPSVLLSNLSTLTDINNGNNDYGFSGWEITALGEISDTDKFAIIVTFVSGDTTVVINSISLTAGDIPSRPELKTNSQTLSDCRYYYQKSFLDSQVPMSGVAAGRLTFPQVGPPSTLVYAWTVLLDPIMRTAPSVTLYNPLVAGNQIRSISAGLNWTGSSASVEKNQIALFGTTPATNPGDQSAVQYEADARLGIV